MTCREFREGLHEYLDDTLEHSVQAAASEHLRWCPECRDALQRAQAVGRVLQHALERSAEEVALTPDLSARIIAAAQPTSARTGSLMRAGQWLFASPLRPLGASVIVALALFLALHVRDVHTADRLAVAQPRESGRTFTIDVPFQTDGHVGVIHAEFSIR